MALVASTLLARSTTAFVLRPSSSPRPHAGALASLVHSTTSRSIRTRAGSSLAESLRSAWDRVLRSAASMEEEVDPGVVEGTDLRVVKYPDPRLRAPNAEVTEFTPELTKLAKDMFKVMYAMNGVGLAAPQVGVNQRLMVFNPDGDKLKWLSETVLVNPVIVEKSTKTDVMEEGCLSFPGMAGEVRIPVLGLVVVERARGHKSQRPPTTSHSFIHSFIPNSG